MVRLSPGGDAPTLSSDAFSKATKRIEEQLQKARTNAELLDTRAREYDDLKKVLKDLPEKVQHPIMVPLGPLAFFEGHLEHTGEVLCQLSSEYFALRTVKHAVGMVDRRRARLQIDQDDVAKELKELDMRHRVARGAVGESDMDVTVPDMPGASVQVDADGFFDIREPLVEEDSAVQGKIELSAALGPDHDPIPNEAVFSPPSRVGAAEATATSAVASADAVPTASATSRSVEISPPMTSCDRASEDALARLRELERMEEMDELDELMEKYAGDDGTGPVAGAPTEPAVGGGPLVQNPGDIFRIMSCVDEAANRRTPPSLASVRAAAGASPEEAPDVTSVNSSVAPPLEPVPAQAPLPGVGDHIHERVTVSERDPAGAPGDSKAPGRVSKFKSDRLKSRG